MGRTGAHKAAQPKKNILDPVADLGGHRGRAVVAEEMTISKLVFVNVHLERLLDRPDTALNHYELVGGEAMNLPQTRRGRPIRDGLHILVGRRVA